jgi:hypothetical protein
MDTQVAERPQTVEAPTELVDRHDVDTGQPEAAAAQPPGGRDGWRWITDPADADVPPPAQPGPSDSGLLVKALAWVSLQYRA